MQRTSLAVRVGGGLAFLALGAGYFLLSPLDSGPAPDAGPARATAAVFEIFAAQSREAAFAAPSGSWSLALPDDHGGHDAARVETWTVLAHLATEDGDPVSLQLSMARLGLVPPDAQKDVPPSTLSALYRSHVILADTGMESVYAEERLSRSLGAAGHDPIAGEVWLDDWRVAYGEGETGQALSLDLTAEDVPIVLELSPVKPAEQSPQDQGIRGFAIPRLAVDGQVGSRAVQGTAILSRAWGDIPLPGGAVANDILSAQLDDGSDLSLVRTARRDGRGAAVLDGLISDADAAIFTLGEDAYSMEPVPGSGRGEDAALTTSWRISGPGLVLDAVPLMAKHHEDFAFGFSSGLFRVAGTRDGRAVAGLGSLQSTGRAREP